MILALRSLLWHHGAITGTCDTSQGAQQNDGTGFTPVVAHAGGSLPARRRSVPAPAPLPLPEIPIPAIVGVSITAQRREFDSARAALGFSGDESTVQLPQECFALGDMFDVELEMMAALLMEVA